MTKKYYILTAVASYLLLLLATIPAKLVNDLANDNSRLLYMVSAVHFGTVKLIALTLTAKYS